MSYQITWVNFFPNQVFIYKKFKISKSLDNCHRFLNTENFIIGNTLLSSPKNEWPENYWLLPALSRI